MQLKLSTSSADRGPWSVQKVEWSSKTDRSATDWCVEHHGPNDIVELIMKVTTVSIENMKTVDRFLPTQLSQLTVNPCRRTRSVRTSTCSASAPHSAEKASEPNMAKFTEVSGVVRER